MTDFTVWSGFQVSVCLKKLCSSVMFSGVKNKLQQWRQKKKSPKLMSSVLSVDSFRQLASKNKERLVHLHSECKTVLETLNEQQSALAVIVEDTSAVNEKILRLEDSLVCLESGIKESEEFSTFLEFTASLNEEIEKNCLKIKSLTVEASSLFLENRKLRTELQCTQDHYETAEATCAQLEVEIDHLKFINSLPNWKPFFDEQETTTDVRDEDIEKKKNLSLPFLEEEDSLDYAGFCILSVIDTHVSDKKIKILFELITSYIQDEAYEIAIPLLKTSLEDLVSKYDPPEKIVFTMLEAMAIIYNVTKRLSNAIDIQQQILVIRKKSMGEDKKGLAKTLSSLSVLHGKLEKFKAARNFCRQALDLKSEVYGESHTEVARELHNLGVCFANDGKYSKSIDCLIKASKLLHSSNEETTFWSSRCSSNLASVWIEMNNFSEAKKVLYTVSSNLDKLLQEKTASKEELLADGNKIAVIPDSKNVVETKRILQLAAEIQERLNSLPDI